MSIQTVRELFAERQFPAEIRELDAGTETVERAAAALGVEPALIAKTLAFKSPDGGLIAVTRGDARIDNRKFRAAFGIKPRFMDADEVVAATGHPVGGVCPFGLAEPLPVYLDTSLRDFAVVYPAAGSPNSHVALKPDEICALTGASWVDVCG
ncbi:MAG: Cys-tRNA(Pro)/Cys-tRNA(Cys) deacylase YbaK [Deltaproteobacteria bacterium ADurb.Bin510]|nr:MAG: Cys-tRNA(Pro)/Cys-tRNA(Cys) deacylase YbaK [Deltaproteobacteria bacterium ADurb.Bin510]